MAGAGAGGGPVRQLRGPRFGAGASPPKLGGTKATFVPGPRCRGKARTGPRGGADPSPRHAVRDRPGSAGRRTAEQRADSSAGL